jgi:hypothetical protein
MPVGEHLETWKVHSKGVREWLSHKFYLLESKVPGTQALQDAINLLAGIAKYQGPERGVFIRIAEHDGCVWLDLGDDAWNAVRIDRNGWTIVPSGSIPIRFVRRKGMEALPRPVPGGSVNELRSLINFDTEQFTLAMGWLIGAFRPRGPYAVLAVSGEHGSAKSSACKLLRRLIDPNVADLRRPPKDERDVFIAGSNAWVVACNNVSGLKPEISDALCALATDGGFSTRTLFENDEESLFSTRRPVILNGIEEPATRSDLVDRTIGIMLSRIPEDKRLDEDEVMSRFESVRPRVLGAILDGVSAAIGNNASIKLSRKPRMADLATWVTAAEPGLGWKREQFLDAYMGNRAEAHVEVIESSSIGPAILSLTLAGPLVGNATELLTALNQQRGQSEATGDWPKSPKQLGSMLRRLAPNLRAMGLTVELPGKKGKGREKKMIFRLEREAAEPSAWSASPAEESGRSANAPERIGTVPASVISWHNEATPYIDADLVDYADRPVPSSSNGRSVGTIGGPSAPIADNGTSNFSPAPPSNPQHASV